MITHTREFITPEIAKKYLDTSIGNRGINSLSVNVYVRQILSGHFPETHQGIAFDENGHLLDGHHRLEAVIKAQKGIWTDVARGLLRKNVIFVDTGDSRNTKEAMYFADLYSNDPDIRNNETISTVRTFASMGSNIKNLRKLDNSEVIYFLGMYSAELRLIYSATKKRNIPTTGQMRAAALAALLNGETFVDIYNFFEVYGRSIPTDDPTKNSVIVLNWRQQIMAAKLRHAPLSRPAIYIGTQNAIWNYCNGTSVRVCKQTTEPRYPVKDIVIDALQNAKEEDK